MTREQIERAILTSPYDNGRNTQMRRVYGIEDYLFIRGDQMSARQAAIRLGRSPRTITRYRAILREAS
jgi:predicted DNA-binding transcriptional regulator YafY